MPYSELQRFAHVDPVERGASVRLRDPMQSHLQRLLRLARNSDAVRRVAARAATLPR